MKDYDFLSTSLLAKKYNISSKELFKQLEKTGLVYRGPEKWMLTEKGKEAGGVYKQSKNYGHYIAWPQNLHIDQDTNPESLITASEIGKAFSLSANKINLILSELGWIKKDLKGWRITEQGKKQGGVQSESNKTGIPFVRWPDITKQSKILIDSINHVLGDNSNSNNQESRTEISDAGFRDKFPAKHRTADGHLVRSKAEMIIDNWLYMAEIVHAYERKLPIEEDVYCDFYLPSGKVYIEFWGYEENEKYQARKKIKQEIYKKYNFNLIELTDKEVLLLDDVLPKYLLKYGIVTY